jgi:MFS family permease
MISAAVHPPKQVVHQNLILAICCMSLLIVGMDVTIVNVALPAIQKDLHARLAGLQWILDAVLLKELNPFMFWVEHNSRP